MSPRDFDSDEVARGDRHVLRFTENVECRLCETVFPGEFVDLTGSMTVEDMTDPPIGTHTCPACGHQWSSELTGWQMFTEAG